MERNEVTLPQHTGGRWFLLITVLSNERKTGKTNQPELPVFILPVTFHWLPVNLLAYVSLLLENEQIVYNQRVGHAGYSHAVMQSLSHAVMQSLSHAVMQSLSHAVMQSLSHAVMQSLSHAVMQSLSHAVMQSLSHAVMQSLSHDTRWHKTQNLGC